MAVRHYTREQLMRLRESPLVQKPDHLPAIERWMEYVYLERDGVRERLRIPHSEAQAHASSTSAAATAQKENGNGGSSSSGGGGGAARQRQTRLGLGPGSAAEGSPMGSFSTGQRPNLSQMRAKTGGERRSCELGVERRVGADVWVADDLTLGPPRTSFPSSRNVAKLSDFRDRTPSTGGAEATPGEEQDSVRSRFFADRQMNRRSTNEKELNEGRGGWGSARDRKGGGDFDEHKSDGRDKGDRNGRFDKEFDGDRRNGHGDRHESRWGSSRDDKRINGDRTGGWRDREQQRRERDTYRGNDKEPEWMDGAAIQKEKDLGMKASRTAEEFEKWKEAMRQGSKPQVDKEPEPADPPPSAAKASPEEVKPPKAALKLEGFEGGMFSTWGASAPAPTPQLPSAPAAKPTSGAPRASRFASMFKPIEEPVVSNDSTPAAAENSGGKTSAEEREGFDRVLAMLGGTKLGGMIPGNDATPASPPRGKSVGGVNGEGQKPKSRFFNSPDPNGLQSPTQGVALPGGPSMTERQPQRPAEMPSDQVPRHPGDRPASEQHVSRPSISDNYRHPDPESLNAAREQQQQQHRPASGRVNEIAFEPPARRAVTPDDNIQNLLAQQRPKPQATSNESQALLNLLIKNTANARTSVTPSQPNNGGAREMSQFNRWLEGQEPPNSTGSRMQQPPGLYEEQMMRNYPSEQPRHEQHAPMQGGNALDNVQRRGPQRAPPGFYDESMFLAQHQQMPPGPSQQQRRNYPDGPHPQMQQQQSQSLPPPPPQMQQDHRMGGPPNLPPMHPMSSAQAKMYHEGMIPSGGHPPPGFNQHLPRHPPGLNSIPNIFQHVPPPPPQPQQQQQSQLPQQQSQSQPLPPPHLRDQVNPRFPGVMYQQGGGGGPPPPPPPPGFANGPPGLPPGFMQQLQQQPPPPPSGQGMRVPNEAMGGMRGGNATGPPPPFDGRYAALR